MSPGDWLRFPVPKDMPLADLEVVVGDTVYPAFRENDQALIRCPNLPGAQRVEVRASGQLVHSTVIRITPRS